MSPAAKKMAAWRRSVGKFAQDCFGFEPDAWQKKAFEAWDRGDQRLAFKACKGPGKTAVLAILVWHFLATRRHPKIACVSISADNLRDNLWTELAKWQGKSEFLKGAFEWTQTRITSREHPETWWASARAWAKSANAEQQANTLAGLHADYMLFILDETGDMPESVMISAEAALATGIETRIVQAGNPLQHEGPLWKACNKERHLWTVIEITGDPDRKDRSTRIDLKWARDQIQTHGRDNPWVMSNVLGEFPSSSPLVFISLAVVEAAIARPPSSTIADALCMGVEVARFGDDEAGIAYRKGRDARTMPWQFYRNIDTMQLAAHVVDARNTRHADAVFVDGGGMGGGVVDRCRQLRLNVYDIQFGGKADRSMQPGAEQHRYANKSAEMWGSMRDWLKYGSIPDDPILKTQLTTRRYAYVNKDGRDCIALEPKDEMKKRGLASPDRADMLALTFAYPVIPNAANAGGIPVPEGHQRQVISDYDPFANA